MLTPFWNLGENIWKETELRGKITTVACENDKVKLKLAKESPVLEERKVHKF